MADGCVGWSRISKFALLAFVIYLSNLVFEFPEVPVTNRVDDNLAG